MDNFPLIQQGVVGNEEEREWGVERTQAGWKDAERNKVGE